MNIIDIYNNLRTQLLPIGLPVYKEIKPTAETGNCIVLNSIPIKKNNVNSIIDIVIILYLKKNETEFDSPDAETFFPQISDGIKFFVKNNSLVTFTERLEPQTLNLNDKYTTTEFIFRTITH